MDIEIQISNAVAPYFEEELKKFNFTPIKNAKIKSNIACFKTEFNLDETCYYMAPKHSLEKIKKNWDYEEPENPVDIIINFLTKDEDKLENTELKEFMPEILALPELNIYTEDEKYGLTLMAYCQIIDDIRYNRR